MSGPLSRVVRPTAGLRLFLHPVLFRHLRLLNRPPPVSRLPFFRHQPGRRQYASIGRLVAKPTPAPVAHLGASGKTMPRRKLGWYFKVLALVAAEAAVVAYVVDKYMLGSVMQRSLRAYGTLARVGLDYKLHGGPKAWLSPVNLDELHQRNAKRICDMLGRNGGLYLKAGQAIAIQGGVVPERYQQMFRNMFDSAPKSSWDDISAVIREDFGRPVEELFGDDVEVEPRASASIAQVHFARLPDGGEVAIKVQKPQIAKQVSWDLRTLKLLIDLIARATGLPMETLGKFMMDHIMEETDFEREARNSNHMAELVASHQGLRDRVYIPKVYSELSSKRVLTTEWIHGVKLWDKEAITAPYEAGTGAARDSTSPTGLGLKLGDVMETLLELFSAQMFTWGFVHCDPHPGNLFVRRLPSGKPQIVLIDHGLYIQLHHNLRRQYALFWKSLLVQDKQALGEVSAAWGMKSADPWADIFLMRAKAAEPPPTDETPEEKQQRMIEEAGGYLGEEGLFPQELVFLERNLGIMQGNNRHFGSPVNRIKLIGLSAMRAVQEDRQETLWQSWKSRWAILTLDTAFYISAVRQYFGYGGGFEEDLKEEEDRTVRELNDAVSELFGIKME
ncbi:hypothetical protein DL765_006297 [Monosporascus sp. GIB2]|nr:hypothetical protein DL765_006297 [Monosporascus sp. GIB2]